VHFLRNFHTVFHIISYFSSASAQAFQVFHIFNTYFFGFVVVVVVANSHPTGCEIVSQWVGTEDHYVE
jgi:sterol desaturase/sphingolipid hydroxylase (fatty acid hydroxylase superfamily)